MRLDWIKEQTLIKNELGKGVLSFPVPDLRCEATLTKSNFVGL